VGPHNTIFARVRSPDPVIDAYDRFRDIARLCSHNPTPIVP